MALQKLHPGLQKFVKENWRDGLRPIQLKAFDPIFSGSSCTLEAPTSGGKTEAVLFPLLTRIALNKEKGFKVLMIAPLKALLNDLALRVEPYAEKCFLEAFKWHGDVGQAEKLQQMRFPGDVLMTTPESIEAMLLRKSNWRDVFRHLESIVVDEAHYFALTDRGSHLVSLLERLENGIARKVQRIAVTATIGNPGSLLHWITAGKGGEPLSVKATTEKERDFRIEYFVEDGKGVISRLYSLLQGRKSLVFEKSRTGTEDTATALTQMNMSSGSPFPLKVKTHHSSVSKSLREDAEDSIKMANESSLNAIICTSTLELGIDIGELDRVIQIGGLNSSGSFLQRVGRTGRRADRPQYFRGLCYNSDELVLLTGSVNLGMRKVSESILFPRRAFHILAHQILCFTLQEKGSTRQKLWNALKGANCFSMIVEEEFLELIDFMISEDYLRSSEDGTILTSERTEKEFLRANWRRLFAIFDSGPMYTVVDGKKVIGTLDSGFARSKELPFVFVLGGYEWFALKIDHELQQVSVKANDTGTGPSWLTISNYDVPFEVAQEVGKLLMTNEQLPFLDESADKQFEAQRSTYRGLKWKDSSWVISSLFEDSGVQLWTFSGERINRTISKILEEKLNLVTQVTYMSVSFRNKNPKIPVDLSAIFNAIEQLKSLSVAEMNSVLAGVQEEKAFSKFSDCLPVRLNIQTLVEMNFDCLGLCRELGKVTIDRLVN